MANPEHLEILKQGVGVWNRWRKENLDVVPDLREADFTGTVLSEADFTRAILRTVCFSGAYLNNVYLRHADLSGANLTDTKFQGTSLRVANLSSAVLRGADLTGADLGYADLNGADFSGAILRSAMLGATVLRATVLHAADLTAAYFAFTVFANIDLSTVIGLETVRHDGPSTIGIDTIYKSKGKIPESFLRGCGVPDTLVTFARSLVVTAFDYHSVFISYSSKNHDFAERLHADLRAKGVRCFFAPEDLKIGDKIRPRIDETIRLHDKLLLVISEHSVVSQWVEQEVETALDKEREQGRTVLFPIRLDDCVMQIKSGWPALIKNTRNIGDFTNWKDHDSYRKAFERLLCDLKSEGKAL